MCELGWIKAWRGGVDASGLEVFADGGAVDAIAGGEDVDGRAA